MKEAEVANVPVTKPRWKPVKDVLIELENSGNKKDWRQSGVRKKLKKQRRRLMETKAVRMRELAQERANKLRQMKLSLANQANLEREQDYMNQVSTTSGLMSGLGSSSNRGFNPATAAAQLGPDGLPIQFGLDDIYRGKSQMNI